MSNTTSKNPFFGNDIRFANPFETAPAVDEVPANAPEGSYTYAMVASSAPVESSAVEADAIAIEIVVKWGESVLKIDHLENGKAFFVGEADAMGLVDFTVEGITRTALISGSELSIPTGATGRYTAPDGSVSPVAGLGTTRLALGLGAKASIELNGLVFAVEAVRVGKKVAAKIDLESRGLPYTGLSMLLHVGLLAATALFAPPLGATDETGVSEEQRHLIQTALQASADKEMEERKLDVVDEQKDTKSAGGEGQRAAGSEGAAGNPASNAKGGRFGFKGDKNNTDVHPSRAQALQDATNFGMAGMLRSLDGGDPNTLTAPWGAAYSSGNDAKSAMGGMWGATIDESGGSGLSLSGVGEGGGCRGPHCGEGIGLGNIGTVGHMTGPGGFGQSHGRVPGTHDATKAPKMTPGPIGLSGRLPAEVIQRTVRQNFGRFRMCYENGLRANPNLQGRVGVRFVIGRDGAVSSAQNGGSDLPDSGVVSCVTRAFYGLSFPAPDGGIVTVTYPIVFSPGN